MNPTTILKEEHQVILQVLACLEKIADNGLANRRLDAGDARKALDFFRNFADKCHHGKEEEHLFPMMEAKGFPRDGGPTGVMLYEHEEGRGHIRAMDGAAGPASCGDGTALRTFADQAYAYIRLLRDHIDKEDHCLFAMADQAFSEEDRASLLERFNRVERHEMDPGLHERCVSAANELAEKYGVPAASAPGCGCHGQ